MILDKPHAAERRDWHDLLDDPHVVVIIRQEARRAFGRDPFLNDDIESFLTLASVSVARRYLTAYADVMSAEDPDAAWYGFLRKALQMEARGHFKSMYGRDGSARRAAMTGSLDAVLEAAPWREAEARAVVSHHEGPNPGDNDIRGTVLHALSERPEITVDDVMALLPMAKRNVIGEVLRQMTGQGKLTRTTRGARHRPARFALADEAGASTETRPPDYIAQAVRSVAAEKTPFSPKDIAAAAPAARRSSVTSVLSSYVRRGVLSRVGHGLYAMSGAAA